MKIPSLVIGNRIINNDTQPYIIAEAGSNFDQSLDKALKLIDIASEAGADAVKFQLFDSNILYPNKDGLYDVFKSIELNKEWIPKLKDYAHKRSIHFGCSAFDLESLNVLEEIGIDFHKIASSEANNFKLLLRLASQDIPTIISTGMCNSLDVEEVVSVFQNYNNNNFALLQCIAQYPAEYKELNLKVLKTFSQRYNNVLGFSDHTLDNVAASVAVGLGASIFEKHFTIDKSAKGPDHFYALEPKDLKEYIDTIKNSYSTLGSLIKNMIDYERLNSRREGLYSNTNISKGSKIISNMIVCKRPALGICSRYQYKIINAIAKKDIQENSPITWDLITY